MRLEHIHHLDRKNPHHLWLLHSLFLPLINEDCDEFLENWNLHAMRGGMSDLSPADAKLLDALECGEYADNDAEDGNINPSTLAEYYNDGDQAQRLRGTDPNKYDSEEDEEEYASEDEDGDGSEEDPQVAEASDESDVDIPEDADAWAWDDEDVDALVQKIAKGEELFRSRLAGYVQSGTIPHGMGMLPEEWDGDEYPSTETLQVGQARAAVTLDLPIEVWKDRALVWCQALYQMTAIIMEEEMDEV
ncbi:hypothetical protein EVJ58_g8223 [Rhodofomes roseus]|uniref:Integrase core domain-containing protein n=1 Tax=Rhodofomes roseus TaxID=34475 RepID=A0A4Y9Y1N1_9APHY|nr:hypothetical protein EVJ58_g8223 [Rhodofomes roseus]